jgi:amino-acid N-acetyltransferase
MVTVRKAADGDRGLVLEILREAGLPTDDFTDGEMVFLVAEEEGAVVGTIGLEYYPPAGLLRSAAVRPSHRERGVGALLVAALMEEARSGSLTELVLLTTTAGEYFGRMGFTRVARDSMAGPVLSSRQFTGTTCSSAAVMRLGLR